jgi:hypothetical protein
VQTTDSNGVFHPPYRGPSVDPRAGSGFVKACESFFINHLVQECLFSGNNWGMGALASGSGGTPDPRQGYDHQLGVGRPARPLPGSEPGPSRLFNNKGETQR